MTRALTTTLCALLWIASAPIQAQDDPALSPTPGTAAPQTGHYTAALDQRSPLSTVKAVTARFRTKPNAPPEDYDLADESFEIYIPANYDGTEPFGLIVWISPGPHGAPPEHYRPILDKHKLLWIGANNSGNPRSFWHRAGLALDGLHHANQQFNLDPMRTYVSGLSGGGRCSSRIGLTYADLFAGAFPMIGVDYFKRLPHPDSTATKLQFWGAAFNPPIPKILRKAKRDCRFVLLTGETDGNRMQTLVTFEFGLKRAKFAHITYLEVPGMGHTLPPADWFEKGIAALDAPLDEVRDRRETEAKHDLARALDRLQRSPPHGIEALQKLIEDYPDTTYAPLAIEHLNNTNENTPTESTDTAKHDPPEKKPASPTDRAREDLALARNYLQANRPDLAKQLLDQIIEHFPDSQEAERARALLEGMTAQD